MEKQQFIENREESSAEKKITDIALATYLTCNDTVNQLDKINILRIDKITEHKKSWESKKSIFVFAKTPEVEAKILKFFNREAKVDPVQFSEAFRNLKSYTRQ